MLQIDRTDLSTALDKIFELIPVNVTFLFLSPIPQPVENYIPSSSRLPRPISATSTYLQLYPTRLENETNDPRHEEFHCINVEGGRGEFSPLETVSFQPITINASGVSSAFVYIEFRVFFLFFVLFHRKAEREREKILPLLSSIPSSAVSSYYASYYYSK